MQTITVRRLGDSLALELSPEALALLKVREGDEFRLGPTPEGEYRLIPCRRAPVAQMVVAEEILRENKEFLALLAKR